MIGLNYLSQDSMLLIYLYSCDDVFGSGHLKTLRLNSLFLPPSIIWGHSYIYISVNEYILIVFLNEYRIVFLFLSFLSWYWFSIYETCSIVDYIHHGWDSLLPFVGYYSLLLIICDMIICALNMINAGFSSHSYLMPHPYPISSLREQCQSLYGHNANTITYPLHR